MRISVRQLLLTVFLTVMLLPTYFSNPAVSFLNNVLFLAAVAALVKNKYKPNQYIIAVGLFYADLIIMTAVYGHLTPNILVYNTKIIVLMAFIHFMYKKNQHSTLKIVTGIIVLFVLVDFATIIIWPKGLYITTTVYSQWNSENISNWLLGNKNNRIIWELSAISLTKISCDRGILKKRSLRFIMLIAVLAIVFTKSSTSIVAVTVLCGAVLFQKAVPLGRNSMKVFLIGYCVLTGLVMFGNAGFLAPIVEGMLGKDITFTGRAGTWRIVIAYILQKPVFGWGYVGSEQAMKMISKAAAVNAHSQWLQALLQGGAVEFFILAFLIASAAKYFGKVCSESRLFYLGGLFSLLLVMIFEVVMGNLVLIFLFFMMESSKRESESLTAGAEEEKRRDEKSIDKRLLWTRKSWR